MSTKRYTRYVPTIPTGEKAKKFFNPKSQAKCSYVTKRKIYSKRLIHKADHERVGIYKLLKDIKLNNSVSMVKPFNREIMQ